MEKSITETFRNGTFLVTGGTGYLGKTLLERLLRSCSVKKIAIIVRSKKGISTQERAANLCEQAIFERLRMEKPNFMDYIKVIEGDLEEKTITSSADRQWLIENVNYIFHCAATVKFNEPLEVAFKINVLGTEHLLALATEIQNLKGLVHVSTAYSNFPRSEIKEQYYPPPITAVDLKNIISHKNKSTDILGNWPNTYTFTKSIQENSISRNDGHLPISVFRPSIIGCSVAEPEPGWTDNIHGGTGVFTSIIIGILRTYQIDTNKVADIVPIDYTANALISVMWDTVIRYQDPNAFNEEPKIYNYVSSPDRPVVWKCVLDGMTEKSKQYPPLVSTWYSFCIYSTKFWMIMILRFLLHRIPAVFVDLSLLACGKKAKMLKMYQKLESSNDTVVGFTTKEWKFDNSNTIKLWSSLNQEDRKTFYFSFDGFDWNSYITIYFHGIRKNILKENLSNLEVAVAKHRKLFWLHNLFIVVIFCTVVHLSWLLIKL